MQRNGGEKMIEWKEGAVCYAVGWQRYSTSYVISGLTNGVTTTDDYKDFQLNEIRIGDYIEKSELDTEQKYNDVVDVFGLFGFPLAGTYETFKRDRHDSMVISLHGNAVASKFEDSIAAKRKLTYNQIMAIGKLKRMMNERKEVKESEPVVRVGAGSAAGLADAHRKINEALSNPRVSADNLKDGAKYVKTLYGLDGKKTTVDVYRVLDAFPTGSSEIDHAVKKLLNAGNRGHKDELTDLYNAIESIEARINLIKQKGDS